jgi:hypothetical protein
MPAPAPSLPSSRRQSPHCVPLRSAALRLVLATGQYPVVARSEWQKRYDQSIRETDEAMARAKANRSTWEKILDRSTGSGLDIVIVPVVALGHGVAGLFRRRRGQNR